MLLLTIVLMAEDGLKDNIVHFNFVLIFRYFWAFMPLFYIGQLKSGQKMFIYIYIHMYVCVCVCVCTICCKFYNQ